MSLLEAGTEFQIQEQVNASVQPISGINTMDRISKSHYVWTQNFINVNHTSPNIPKRARTSRFKKKEKDSLAMEIENSKSDNVDHESDPHFTLEDPENVNTLDEVNNVNIRRSKRQSKRPLFFDDSDIESVCLDVIDNPDEDSCQSRGNCSEEELDMELSTTIEYSSELIDLDNSVYNSLSSGIVDNKLVALSKLEKILRKCNAPLFLFHEIQEYIHQYGYLYGDEEIMSRKQFYRKIAFAVYGKEFSRFKPITHILKLPSEEIVDVIYYDFISQVYSILSDRNITNYENTIFKYRNHQSNSTGDPFYTPHSWKATEGDYEDIETTVYHRTLFIRKVNELAKSLGISFEEASMLFITCPLLLFTDGTLITRSLSSGLEPVTFTLGILNQETRNKHEAWRLLTVVPTIKSSLTPKQKLEDYHAILNFVLQAIMKKIENYAFTWTIFDKNGNALPSRNLIFTPYCFAGDAAGHAKLCGKYNNFSNVKCISRDCDCRTEEADNVNVECNMLFHDDMMSKSEKELKELSFYKLDNFAFKKNIFGYNPLGIWGATPPEPLHLLFGGLVDYIYKAFHDKLYKEQARMLDKCVKRIAGFHYRHTCKDEYPRMSLFKNGLELKGSIAAKDKVARIFMLYLVHTCEEWRNYIVGSKWKQFLEGNEDEDEEPVKTTTDKRTTTKKTTRKSSPVEITNEMYVEWLRLFEHTFVICKWITHGSKKRIDFIGRRESIAYKCVQNYLEAVSSIVKRDKAGLKLLKFHHILHVPTYMPFITMASVNTCIHENHHIAKVKHTGRNTQQRASSIRNQTMQRVFESDSLDRFISLYSENEQSTRNTEYKHTFKLQFDYTTGTAKFKWLDKRKKGSIEPPPELLHSVFEKFKSYNGGIPYARLHSIRGYTNLEPPNRNYNRPIRAVENLYGDPWFDWVEVKWTDDIGILPARIYMILDFREPALSCISFHYNIQEASQIASVARNDIQVLIHSARKEKLQSNKYILKHAKLLLARQFEMESTLQWVSFNHVLRPAFVYQDWDRKFFDREKRVPSFMERPNFNDCMMIPHDVDWHEMFMQTVTSDTSNTGRHQLEVRRERKERKFGNIEPDYDDFF